MCVLVSDQSLKLSISEVFGGNFLIPTSEMKFSKSDKQEISAIFESSISFACHIQSFAKLYHFSQFYYEAVGKIV